MDKLVPDRAALLSLSAQVVIEKEARLLMTRPRALAPAAQPAAPS